MVKSLASEGRRLRGSSFSTLTVRGQMTPDYLHKLVIDTDRSLPELTKFMGYDSDAELRKALDGGQMLPSNKLEWLQAYAQMRLWCARREERWLKDNPPPQ